MEHTYTKSGEVVKIHRFSQQDIILNEESAKNAVENIKRNRAYYATEEAYQSHLAMFQGALSQFAVVEHRLQADGDLTLDEKMLSPFDIASKRRR